MDAIRAVDPTHFERFSWFSLTLSSFATGRGSQNRSTIAGDDGGAAPRVSSQEGHLYGIELPVKAGAVLGATAPEEGYTALHVAFRSEGTWRILTRDCWGR